MARSERVVFAFRALGEAAQASALPEGADSVAPSGQDLVGVGLMADVPDDAIGRRVEYVVERHRQFDDPEACAQMPAGHRNRADRLGAQFAGDLGEVARAQFAQIGGRADLIQERRQRLVTIVPRARRFLLRYALKKQTYTNTAVRGNCGASAITAREKPPASHGLAQAAPGMSEFRCDDVVPPLLAIGGRASQICLMMLFPAAALDDPDIYAPDGPYAFARLALSLLISTLVGAGMWAVIVVLPQAQLEFGVDRAAASLPYTVMMCTLAFASIALGRMTDRGGIAVPMAISGASLGVGFVLAGYAPNLMVFSAAHLLIGVGAGTGFGPMMADISHWFVKRRGLAVVVVASGNYLAGTVWPLLMSLTMPLIGWRATYAGIGLIIAATVLPLALLMRRRPSAAVIDEAEEATRAARADAGISPRLLLVLLVLAGFSCCVAMSMPQVHLVAYCGDLGYGVARGAEMLSLMMLLGIVSRIGSGIVADAIGGAPTLMIGSFMQGVALMLYLYFNGLTSLFVVSGIFGLFQGGIVPMYAVICRELLPPRQAGAVIGLVVSATIFGMAFGGYASGVIFDLTSSYRMAFLNGVLWNALNFAIVAWLFWRRQRRSPTGRLLPAA